MFERLNKKRNEQHHRELRLEELKNQDGGRRYSVLHPIKTVKNNAEKRALEKQIREYNEKKKSFIILCVMGALSVVLLAISIAIAAKEQKSDDLDKRQLAEVETDVCPESSLIYQDNIEEEIPVIFSSSEDDDSEESALPNSSINVIDEEVLTNSAEELSSELSTYEVISEEVVDDEMDLSGISHISIDDIEGTYWSDYAHVSSETITLGNKESATIHIKSNAESTIDDILLVYDNDVINIKAETVNDREYYYTVTGKKAGYTYIEIATVYDALTKGDDVEIFRIFTQKLDSEDGRICYFSTSGTVYHFSSSCAPGSAYKTTVYDAKANGLPPCKKCAY